MKWTPIKKLPLTLKEYDNHKIRFHVNDRDRYIKVNGNAVTIIDDGGGVVYCPARHRDGEVLLPDETYVSHAP